MSQLNKFSGKVLPVRIYGDKVLRQKSLPVEKIDDELRSFISDMITTMYAKDGVGLAAPQVGVNLRIFVVDPDWFRTNIKNPKVLINPTFISMSGIDEHEEGCLSLPDIAAEVKRPDKVVVEALNEEGNKMRYEVEGFYARAIQHEYDHIDGILFTDRVSKLKLLTLKRRLKLLEQKTDEDGVNLDSYFTDNEADLHRNS